MRPDTESSPRPLDSPALTAVHKPPGLGNDLLERGGIVRCVGSTLACPFQRLRVDALTPDTACHTRAPLPARGRALREYHLVDAKGENGSRIEADAEMTDRGAACRGRGSMHRGGGRRKRLMRYSAAYLSPGSSRGAVSGSSQVAAGLIDLGTGNPQPRSSNGLPSPEPSTAWHIWDGCHGSSGDGRTTPRRALAARTSSVRQRPALAFPLILLPLPRSGTQCRHDRLLLPLRLRLDVESTASPNVPLVPHDDPNVIRFGDDGGHRFGRGEDPFSAQVGRPAHALALPLTRLAATPRRETFQGPLISKPPVGDLFPP